MDPLIDRDVEAREIRRTASFNQDAAATYDVWTGIPVAKMLEAETEKLLRMEDRFKLSRSIQSVRPVGFYFSWTE